MKFVLCLLLSIWVCSSVWASNSSTVSNIRRLQAFIAKNYQDENTQVLNWYRSQGTAAPEVPEKLRKAYQHFARLYLKLGKEIEASRPRASKEAFNRARIYTNILRNLNAKPAASALDASGISQSDSQEKKQTKPTEEDDNTWGSLVVSYLQRAPQISIAYDGLTETLSTGFQGLGVAIAGDLLWKNFRLGAGLQGFVLSGDIQGKHLDYNQKKAQIYGAGAHLHFGFNLSERLSLLGTVEASYRMLRTQKGLAEVKLTDAVKMLPGVRGDFRISDNWFLTGTYSISESPAYQVGIGVRFP